jgi:hypothetical protein
VIGADRGERVTLRRAAHDTGGVCFAPAREIVRAVVPHVGYWSAAVGVMNRCAETVYPFTPTSRGEPRSFTEFRDTVVSGYEVGRMGGRVPLAVLNNHPWDRSRNKLSPVERAAVSWDLVGRADWVAGLLRVQEVLYIRSIPAGRWP